jgi:adenosylcobinamide-GDP ribazoletransferase
MPLQPEYSPLGSPRPIGGFVTLNPAILSPLGFCGIAVSVILGRLALTLLCSRLVPPARLEGLGAAVAGSVPLRLVLGVFLATMFGATALLWFYGGTWMAAPSAGLVVLVVVGALGVRTVKRFGGITGDVLGAGVEVATAAAAVVLAALL